MKSQIEISLQVLENEIKKQCKYYPTLKEFKIRVRETSEFTFLSFVAKIDNSSLVKYGVYCLRGFEIIYQDSNVTDPKDSYPIDRAIEKAKGYFNYYSKMLNQLKF